MAAAGRSKPSAYPLTPFYCIRALSFVASTVVSGIIGWFWYQLRQEGFKFPWTLLLILTASSLTSICLILTTIIQGCAQVSPLFNLFLNVPLSILWITGFSLFTYNTVGTLSHSCSISNWGDSNGVMICRCYKANYSFITIGVLSSVAMVIVDIRARVRQNSLRRDEAMGDSKSRLLDQLADDHGSSTTLSRQASTGYNDVDGQVPYGVDPDGPLRRLQDDRRQQSFTHLLGTTQVERENSPYVKVRSWGGTRNMEEEYSLQDIHRPGQGQGQGQGPVHQSSYGYGAGTYRGGYLR